MSYYPPTTNLRFVNTTPEQERELFRRWAEDKDITAQDEIIQLHLLYASVWARKYAAGRFQDEDVISAANEVLVLAVEQKKFDYTRGNRFTGYLRPLIRGVIKKMRMQRLKHAGLTEKTAGESVTRSDEPTVEDVSVEETDFVEFIRKALDAGKNKLDERSRLILSLMYEQGLNMAQVGRQLKITRERVRQLHGDALETLRRTLNKHGVSSV